MDSIGGHDDEIQQSKINSVIERIDDETQPFDSPSSPPSATGVGNEGYGFNELDVLHGTLPFDDIIPHEDVFETQFLNFGGETQVLDDPEVVKNGGTQLLDDYENEIVVDTDGEETQVLGDTEELSDEDAIKRVGIYPVEEGQNLSIPTGKQDNQALRKESDCLNDKHHVSGSAQADFTSVCNAAFRASGLAARSRASEGTNSESCSTKSAALFTKLHAADEIEIAMIRDSSILGEEVDDGDFPGLDDEQIKELRTKSNCRADCSTVRRLFTEDTLIESKEPNDSLNNAVGNETSGLSYIDSQEPGELSQANAMAFVDRFIKFDVMDFNQEDELGRSTGGKSEPVSCAKGTQSFVKRTNLEVAAGKRRIFDWDDNLEDEGGGEFFIKKKEAFFDTEDRGNTSFPRKGSVISSSGLPLHNPKSSKAQNVNEKKFKKKHSEKLDDLLNIGSSDGIEYTNTYKDVPEMLDVGVDTQIAAEAMETLCFGLDVVDPDSNNTDKGDKNMCARSCRGEKTKRSQSKKGGARKAPSSPSSGFISPNSKKTKRISSKSGKKSAVSSQKQAENLSKECGTNMVKEELKKFKSNGEGCFATKQIKNTDKVSSADLEQLGEEQAQKRNDTGKVDRRHVFESSSGCMSVKKRCLEEEFSNSTPIARRTRQSKVQKFNDTTATFTMGALGYNRGKRTCRKLSSKSMGNGGLHASFNQSVVQGTNGQSPGKLKKGSLINALSTSVDVGNKRQAFLDGQSIGSLFKHIIDKSSSGNATIKSKSGDRNVFRKNAKASVHLEASPGDRCKPSSLASTTPVNCTTPINAASPVCMGDEYFKQSCRKNLSRSLLGKEVNSLISNGPEPTFTFKDSRRRRDMASVQVLFSQHLDEDIIKQQKKILARLGASVASSISEATHFVADKFVRTKNILESIAFGKPVVTHLWIESCGQANCFIDERNYIVRDAKKEKEFGFSLPVSLARACQRPLLQGHKVLITPNTKPGKDILANLVRAVHGLAVERIGRSALKGDNIPDELLVLSCEEDYALCMPFLEKGSSVYTSELLLNGIVTQKLEFERHRLFADHVKKTRSTIWLKRDKNQYLPVSKRK